MSGQLPDTPRLEPDAAPEIDWDAVAGRPAPRLEMQRLTERFAGRRVLVTGAAGSLGWPLVHVLAALPLAELALVDVHEPSLFGLRQVLGERASDQPTGAASVRYVLADIRRAARVESLLDGLRPQVIFHLAACKHVPWAEEDPVEFVATNVLGTFHLVRAAVRQQVERIVYPSTDKAIAPPSLYGVTKRIAEGMLRAAASAGRPSVTVCRFVNVLGSRGAASETFVRLIGEDRPLPITDARMRRYWISPSARARLALARGAARRPVADCGARHCRRADAGGHVATRLWQQLRPAETGPSFIVLRGAAGRAAFRTVIASGGAVGAAGGARSAAGLCVAGGGCRQDHALCGVGASVC